MKKLTPSPPARKLILRDGLPFAAEAAGILGLRAETPEQVPSMIAEALRHDGPALVEVLVNRQELSMPPTITLEQVKGFSLFMLKAVLSGRGDEIVDLAKTNLFR
jgi:pyruvate dehydrogenase (quinone)